jgi:predicted DNA-binding transcriptional regulator AlpA
MPEQKPNPKQHPVETEAERRRRLLSSAARRPQPVHHRQQHRDSGDDDDGDSPATDPLALITKADLARLLNVTPWTLDRWRKADPSFPEVIWLSDSTPRWRRIDVEKWLASRQRGGTSPDFERRMRSASGR